MRQTLHRVGLFIIAALLTGCESTTVLTTSAFRPGYPHIVLKSGDTIKSGKVAIRRREMRRFAFTPDSAYRMSILRYVQTDPTHRYVAIGRYLLDQSVSGRINLYGGKGAVIRSDSDAATGTLHVRLDHFAFAQKLPEADFHRPGYGHLNQLMYDYPASISLLKQSRHLRNGMFYCSAGGAITAVASLALFFAAIYGHSDASTYYAVGSVLTGSSAIGFFFVGLPLCKKQSSIYKLKAIEAYNRQ